MVERFPDEGLQLGATVRNATICRTQRERAESRQRFSEFAERCGRSIPREQYVRTGRATNRVPVGVHLQQVFSPAARQTLSGLLFGDNRRGVGVIRIRVKLLAIAL